MSFNVLIQRIPLEVGVKILKFYLILLLLKKKLVIIANFSTVKLPLSQLKNSIRYINLFIYYKFINLKLTNQV